MSNERKPLLSDKEMLEYIDHEPYSMQKAAARAAVKVREYYEALITEGKLRMVLEVELRTKGSWPCCSGCNEVLSTNAYAYCPGCGNPVKKP